MNRITEANLQAVVDRINRMIGSPMTPYGGVCLRRMHTDGGGVSSPLSIGHVLKRELYHAMFAFIAGLNAATEGAQA